ncbi:hypothetical protein [Streptomyces lavendulocolor]|uniref:hypothetical protein n=1 Tax=Streptomyces lavendulocolor TaxID=67316 RepID=UPI0031D8A9B9
MSSPNPNPAQGPTPCVESGHPARQRLSGSEAAVVIIVITLAAALVAVARMSTLEALQLIGGAGLTAILLVVVITGVPNRRVRATLRAVVAPAV